MMMKSFASLFLSLSLVAGLGTSSALACATCYGNNQVGTKMGDAANWGIFAMCVIMFAMLGSVFALIRYLAWREKNPLPNYDALLQQSPGETANERITT